MPLICLIPGMGADARLFAKVLPEVKNCITLEWQKPENHFTLADYAVELLKQIPEGKPYILIGVSLGGIMAVEMAKIRKPEKIVLISSAKTYKEIPPYYRIFRYFPVYKVLSSNTIDKIAFILQPLFGKMNKAEYKVYKDMLVQSDIGFIKWACRELLRWRNTWIPENILHLHGTEDYILPFKYIQNCTAIAGGSHYMVLKKPKEISQHLQQFIFEKQT